MGMEVCCTLGMLTEAQAHQLKDAGLTAYNHNLDTSPEFYGNIISTRVYEERLQTIAAVRQAGITVCCGGILGMGESDADRIGLLHQLATLEPHPESVPINMLARAEGPPLERQRDLDPLPIVTTILYSNDYVGLAADPRLKLPAIEAVAQTSRTGSTGSRLLSGHAVVWDELEEEFAEFAGTPAALYFNSGYAANTGLLSAILTKDDVVFSDSLNHASLIDGVRLSGARKVIYPHCDLNALEAALKDGLNHTKSGHRVIVTESIFSMDGDRAPLPEMVALAKRYGAEVIVDEAHATGTQGKAGRAIVASLVLQDDALPIVHTCGKALATMCSFLCGSKTLKHYLLNHARSFIASTAIPPYVS